MHQTFAGRSCLEPGNKPRNSAKKSPGLPVLPRTPHPDLILPQLLPAGLRPPDLQTPHPPAGLCSTPVFVPCFQSRRASGSLSLTSLSDSGASPHSTLSNTVWNLRLGPNPVS
uniref:Uncharacterized protein n=1 Tax=Macaca mulatta TaxID=9544 RepID=A0A5F7ZC61_MACMU|nr:uncharacterized protein LOC710230 [Macaca mulatta]